MFGIDWDGDGDGEEGLFDDMMTLDILEGDDNSSNGKPSGSCLAFIFLIGAMVAIPVAILSHIFIA